MAKYCYFTIRLPDDVTSVNGYMFVTANDSLGRSPSEWLVEGSYDGETWTTLDERAGVAQPYCLFTAMNAGHSFTFTSLAAEPGRAALPAGGVLELVNVPAEVTRLNGYEVPITVTDVQDAANLRSWTVIVNGVRRAAKPTYRDGKIVLRSGGTFIIVR